MNNNYRANQIAIKQFRKELEAMFDDIREIDKKCLNKAVNLGSAYAKRNTPVGKYSGGKVGGFMRKNWHVSRTSVTPKGIEKSLYNTADYSSFVNDGHRIVDGKGNTVGFVKGKYILERAIRRVDKSLERELKKEVEEVRRKHDK